MASKIFDRYSECIVCMLISVDAHSHLEEAVFSPSVDDAYRQMFVRAMHWKFSPITDGPTVDCGVNIAESRQEAHLCIVASLEDEEYIKLYGNRLLRAFITENSTRWYRQDLRVRPIERTK
jgi:hypothetical protein